MVYQIKDTTNLRSKGFRCDQSGKSKTISIINKVEKNTSNPKKYIETGKELCIRLEMVLRIFQIENRDNKTWFLDTETAIIYEFQTK